MARRRRYGSSSGSAEIIAPEMNVTPLVDVVLVLLIVLLVIAPRVDQDVPLSLPAVFRADPEGNVQADPLRVTIPKPGEFYFDSQRLDLDTLTARLSDAHAAEPLRRLVLRADENLTYGDVRALLERTQEIGFPGFSFLVAEKSDGRRASE